MMSEAQKSFETFEALKIHIAQSITLPYVTDFLKGVCQNIQGQLHIQPYKSQERSNQIHPVDHRPLKTRVLKKRVH